MSTEDAPPAMFSRLEEFNRFFELSPAMSRNQRKLVYELRYRVYCEEFGYEAIESLGNHQEMDEFDCQSIHCLVTHRESGLPAGCVRVVMVEGNDRMPMESHAGDSIDQRFINTFRDKRETLCEISRLAVDRNFRRRSGDGLSRFGNIEFMALSPEERRSFPLVALALILGAGAVADILGRNNVFAIMEPALPLMMKRAGIHFRRVGADFDFRGVRAPYYGGMDTLIHNAPLELRQYFTAVQKQFTEALLAELPALILARPAPSHDNVSCQASVIPGGQAILRQSLRFIFFPEWLEFT